ncbi:MAG: GGDEF domain-containing protein [Campylobacterales bacterium]
MDKDLLYRHVSELRDEAIAKLEQTKTPAYPKYYKIVFDELMARDTHDQLAAIYKKISETEPHDEISQYIDLAKMTIDSFAASQNDIRSIAQAQGEFLGTIQLDAIEENRVDFAALLSTLVSFQSDLLTQLRKADEKIKSLETKLQATLAEAQIDPLTKAYNRKAMRADLEEILKAGKDRDLDLVLLVIDGDDFKRINDEFGHLAGDKVLIYLVSTFKNSLREGCRVYRYGGEEFVCILNRTQLADAMMAAERIRAKVENSKLLYGDKSLSLTVSIGVAAHRKGDTLESLFERADQALYRAKSEGKNRIVQL